MKHTELYNPNFEDIHCEPIEVSIRTKIGYVIAPNELEKIPEKIYSLLENLDEFRKQIIDQITATNLRIGISTT